MAESIQCYQCGTRMSLAELVKNQDDCPECGAQHSINDVVKALKLNTRAQVSQGGEAVACWLKSSVPGADIVVLGNPGDIHQAATDTKIPLYTRPADQALGGVVVPLDKLQGLIWYADQLLAEVNAGARYAGCTAPEAEHNDADYLELRQLLAKSEGGKK